MSKPLRVHALHDLLRGRRAEDGDGDHDEHPEVAHRPEGKADREGEERRREGGGKCAYVQRTANA